MTAARADYRVLQDDRLSFLLLGGTAADQHADRLFEIQQPERQLEVVDIKGLCLLSERARVFVVRVQHDDVRAGMIDENGSQHQRNGTGFSGAGGAEYGEVLCQQFVDEHKGRPGSIMVEASDADVGGRWPGIDRGQVGFGRNSNGSPRNGMTGYAAMEPSWPFRRRDDLSQQVDDHNNAP